MTINIKNKPKVTDASVIANIIQDILITENEIDQSKEHFWSIGLNCRNRIEYIELVSLGTLTNGLIHPRETYRLAVMKGVASIIVCHNHPSGETEPSREDILITERLKNAGDILGIKLLDHIIITGDSYLSLKQKGTIND